MITTLHTLSLASITHHTNSPRLRLRRPPRARPQLTRPPLHTPVLRRPPRPPELRQSARPLVLTARCPTIARHPPPGAPPAASVAAAHPAAAARPPPAARRNAGHKRDARHVCGSVARRECGRSSPGRHCPPRCCATRRARRSCASPLARPSSQRDARPSPATARRSARRRPRVHLPTRVRLRHPPRARPQLTRAPLPAPVLRRPPRPPELRQSARPPVFAARCSTIAPAHRERGRSSPCRRCSVTARRAAGHKRNARRRC